MPSEMGPLRAASSQGAAPLNRAGPPQGVVRALPSAGPRPAAPSRAALPSVRSTAPAGSHGVRRGGAAAPQPLGRAAAP